MAAKQEVLVSSVADLRARLDEVEAAGCAEDMKICKVSFVGLGTANFKGSGGA